MREVSRELVSRGEADQEMRKKCMDGDAEWDYTIDKENTEYMVSLVDEHGWPKISEVGEDASQAAWLLVQHADHDPDFQARCLELMKTLPEDDVNQIHVAHLEDRVRLNRGQPQLYGTQFELKGSELVPKPIEEPEKLEARRAKMGLGPYEVPELAL